MKNKLNLIATIFALLIFSSFANATVTVPLNTGYDHWNGTAYTGLPKQDDYWINVSNNLNFTPSFAVNRNTTWWAVPFFTSAADSSQWINFQNSWSSAPGTNANNPRYAIYRKCFCLQKGFTQPNMSFKIRSDETVAVWFNGVSNVLLIPSQANSNASPYNVSTTTGLGFPSSAGKGFRVGSNCLYVLVEDTGIATGFNLQGTMTVGAGMLSMPAKGKDQSYAPCSCSVNGTSTDLSEIKDETKRATIMAKEEDDAEVIKEIIKFAEDRRAKRIKGEIKEK